MKAEPFGSAFLFSGTLLKMISFKNLALLLVAVLLSLTAAEVALRLLGYKPGMYIHNRWFTAVTELKMRQGLYADSNGILKVSDDASLTIASRIITGAKSPANEAEVKEVYALAEEATELNNNAASSILAAYVHKLKLSKSLSDIDSAIIEYATTQPVNADGFKSIAFKQYNTTRKKVLLLGDSFTWGHSAQPNSNGFADILLTQGYIVYNTGISGTDAAQYLAVARKYIQQLKPDYVIANFFIGNDVLYVMDKDSIRYYARTVQPYKPVYYSTNAGNLLACPNGKYFDNAARAYQSSYAYFYISPTSFINRVCSYTVCGTLIWKALHYAGWVTTQTENTWETTKKHLQPLPVCNAEMQAIDSLCKANNSKFLLVTINDMHNPGFSTPKDFPHLFEGIQYYPSPVQNDGYNKIDDHYNNEGHRQYARYLQQLLEK